MIYFTSDLHFGHNNIISHCERPFLNIHIMDCVLLDNINEVVKPDDTLYILGDFCFRGKKPIEYRERIKCKNVHLILGNHDKEKDFQENSFSSIQYVKEIIHCNQKIFLSHYPHRSWPSSHKGSFHLYGHCHSKLDKEDRISGKSTLDVGVDNCSNYNKPFGQPWSFKEIQNTLPRRNFAEVIDVNNNKN